MATFITLAKFTDQGIQTAKDTVQRTHNVRGAIERRGGRVLSFHWTMGEYDIVMVAEAPDVQAYTAILLAVGSLGNVRTSTRRHLTHRRCRRSSANWTKRSRAKLAPSRRPATTSVSALIPSSRPFVAIHSWVTCFGSCLFRHHVPGGRVHRR